MRTILGLLVMALTTYATEDTHTCDPRALDMRNKGKGENFLSFNKFLEDQTATGYYVPWATVNSELNDEKFQKFCSGATFTDKHCGITYYKRYVTNTESIEKFRSTTLFFSFNKELSKVTGFQMKVKLLDSDDYIFGIDDSDKENAIQAYFEGDSTKLTLPHEIKEIFNKPFALHDVLLGGKVGIYVMCDSDYAWASVKEGTKLSKEIVDAIEDALLKLVNAEKIKFKNKELTTYITPYSTTWPTLFPGLVAA